MAQVSARELRHRLSEYLARVAAGERFEVTLHGTPVGQFVPLPSARPTMAQLVAEGKVTPAAAPDTTPLPPPVKASTGLSAAEALLAERRGDLR